MNNISRHNIIFCVLLCHFISALSTLGIAPFFSLILNIGFGQKPSLLIGLLYVVPSLLTAIFAPLWGRLADKINKKSALLRAQFGLSLSFLIAALSQGHLTIFIFSLCLQGILGGTLAAANAYLATSGNGYTLSKQLNMTQFSARAAFLIAPVMIGFLLHYFNIFSIYSLLAAITFVSALITARILPCDIKTATNLPQKARPTPHNIPTNIYPQSLPYGLLLLGNFMLSMTLVVSFPYFILMTNTLFHIPFGSFSGLLFGLPHAIYLITLFSLQKHVIIKSQQPWIFISALIVLSLSFVAQILTYSLIPLILARCIMGIAMTISYVSLNTMIANIPFKQKEGAIFGWLDSFNKYGGVAGGIAAGILFSFFGIKSPFIFAGLTLISFCFILMGYFVIYAMIQINSKRSIL
ncbi:MFS transporter [Facilibium subflavum]|uniref:MFS transporter n=1 Tax=Facilibium subflavum TaxID=2219058 RepID=UPI0013C2B1CE|nr:MFS transporter [Facilibium subflavum]